MNEYDDWFFKIIDKLNATEYSGPLPLYFDCGKFILSIYWHKSRWEYTAIQRYNFLDAEKFLR